MKEYQVRAVVAFEGIDVGDTAWVVPTTRLDALIGRGYLALMDTREVESGVDQAGSEGLPESDNESVPAGAEGGGSGSSEPGETPHPGGHGAAPVVNKNANRRRKS